jgi:Ca2+-binding RTX toxin-like protein
VRPEITRTFSRRSFIGRGVGSAAVVLAFALGPAASVVSASGISHTFTDDTASWVYYDETKSETNFVTVEPSAGQVLFTESGGPFIDAIPINCTQISAVQVLCPMADAAGKPITGLELRLEDGNDYADVRMRLDAIINGGGGSDTLKGGGRADWIRGIDGDDVIEGRGGGDRLEGGPGTDTATYAGRNSDVNVSLDGFANDGQAGEGDDVGGPYEGESVENVIGGGGNDTLDGGNLVGVAFDNVLIGGEGQDTLNGTAGNDQLVGGDQSDNLHGGPNEDRLQGQAGFDNLDGGSENDRLLGGDDDDGMSGGSGADFMSGGDGTHDYVDYTGVAAPLTVTVGDGAANDGASGEHDNVQPDTEIVFGGSADDRLSLGYPDGELWGQGGNDQLFGGDNDDRLEGGDGDDRLEGGYRADILSGGNGTDTVDFAWHSYTDPFNGEIGVSSTPNGVADDGNDQIDGGLSGQDNVGADIENVIGSAGPDHLVGTGAANRLLGGAHDDELDGAGGADFLDGESGNDTVDGGNEADTIRGGDDGDRLVGGPDDDALDGGLGSDVLIGQGGTDSITYGGRTGRVAVTLDELRNDGADPNGNGVSTASEEGDLDRGVENATGGDGDDILRALVADSIANTLRGGFGADSLDGTDGTSTVDSLLCGPGADDYRKDPSDSQAGCETALP